MYGKQKLNSITLYFKVSRIQSKYLIKYLVVAVVLT